ncbi:hypothetical protein Tco_0678659 [Tanacetum coccineum]|uniref:Uncharacterized protein n=1 Tax=Tanacetum coccineum TaxID=301880 RepID=A0ABQ4XFP7_9ASTR
MFVAVPFDNLKLYDSNDSTFGVEITSKFPVSSNSIELLTFASPMRDSLYLGLYDKSCITILLGADNRPPMLEKDMYDSRKSRMRLYMLNRQNGRMILESVKSGLLIWPLIVENGVTRPKKYYELSATEALQADCDIKGTNIILQGLPPEVL